MKKRESLPDFCGRVTTQTGFQNAVIATILVSTVLVGLETVPAAQTHYLPLLRGLEQVIVGLFTLELALRIGAHGRQPWRFFADWWNVFDFVIVAICYLPAGQSLVALRLARIVRVLRLLAMVREGQLEHLKNVELKQAYDRLEEEKRSSERLLLNILPWAVAQRLKASDSQLIADSFADATVLFSDLVGFTELSSGISPERLLQLLDGVFSRFDALADKHDVEKIKTIGDAYMAVCGVPEARPDHLHAVAEMALDMLDALAEFNRADGAHLQIRIGFHCGPLVAGIVGHKKFIYDLWGDTVNVASRMESHGMAGRIQTTEAVYQRLRGEYVFEPRGEQNIKGKVPMRTYFLVGRRKAAEGP